MTVMQLTPHDMLIATSELERCRYPSKHCTNKRCRKRNGQLHRFCEEHRERANINQKRWSSSRRDERWKTQRASAQAVAPYPQPVLIEREEKPLLHHSVEFADALESLFTYSAGGATIQQQQQHPPSDSQVPPPLKPEEVLPLEPLMIYPTSQDDSIAFYHMLMNGDHPWENSILCV